MIRSFAGITLILLLGAAAQAATINTTLNVTNASGSFSATGATVTGSAGLATIGTGTFTATVSLTQLSGANLNADFTITLTSGDTIKGTLTIPATALAGGPLTGSAKITGGTGAYAGATGTFPNLTGSASIGLTVTLNFSGAGTIFTGGSGGTPPPTSNTPTVTDVLDAASYSKTVAQGSIFVVKGTNLSASGFTQFTFPLPTTSNGVKITFTPTAGGAGVDAYLIYLYNQNGVNQLAAILPSTVATGNYNVTVTNSNGTSTNFQTAVVQRKPGLITQDSTGAGLAVVQNFISQAQLDVNRFTTSTISGVTISPAKPGQVLIAWATGLGPVSSGDNTASPVFDFLAHGVDVKAIVGGVSITPLYAGRAPSLAGADQINFILPANVPTGCTVSFQISVAGQLSNSTFIAIAPNGSANACAAPGFTTAQLQQFDQGGSFTVGAFNLSQIAETVPQFGTVKLNSIGGGFTRITGFQLASAARYVATGASNACQVIHVQGSANQLANPVALQNLDAGAVTLTGPTGSGLAGVTVTKDAASNAYYLSLGGEGLPTLPGGISATIVAGKYSLHGSGGKDVASFDASVSLGAPLTITGGLPATVTRASGLTLNWTGGNSTDPVSIIGYAGQNTGTGANATVDATEFICTTTAGAGGFTVPADILNQLPAVSASALQNGTATGFLEVVSSVASPFTAALTAGGNIDSSTFAASLGIGALPAYQ